MEPTLDENLEEVDPLQYPYDDAHNCSPVPFQDVFNRKHNWLLASLSRYGHRVQSREASLFYERLEQILPSLTRFSEDAAQSSDFNIILDAYPPRTIQTRHVFESHILEQNDGEVYNLLQTTLGSIEQYEQIAFPHCTTEDNWLVFLVLPEKSLIEVYCIGVYDTTKANLVHLKLCRVLQMAGLSQQFKTRLRMQIPPTFEVNAVVMVFMLVRDIQDHSKYLDLNHEMIMRRKLLLLENFIIFHDRWLGQLTPRAGQIWSHPFITTEYQHKNSFPELERMGWSVVDVLGDGNCGYYCVLLGLENIGETRYSPSTRGGCNKPMRENHPWQYGVIKLRTDLQDHSEYLLESTYIIGNRPLEWFYLTTVLSDDEFDNLSASFHTQELSQEQYFDGTLCEKFDYGKDYTMYQMNPFWCSLVASSRFNIRVIIYTRTASWDSDKEELTYQWSTTTMNSSLPVKEHIVQVKDIQKITDRQLKEIPTIELLYTTGFINEAVPDSQHFQFLRRIICDNVPIPPDPSPDTLQDCIQRLLPTPNTSLAPRPNTNSLFQPNRRQSKGKEISFHRKPIQSKGKKLTFVQTRKVPSVKSRQVRGGRKVTKTLDREKKRRMGELTTFFDEQYLRQTSKHKTATQMRFDPVQDKYYTRCKGTDGKFQRPVLCHDTSDYDDTLVDAADEHPGKWVGPTVGDCGDEPAPHYLCTEVKTLYEQHGNRFCLTYSLASALFYCELKQAAIDLAAQAQRFADMHLDQAISELRAFMENLLPAIGLATLYGIRTKRHSRKKRDLSWDELFNEITPYPTLVIPILPNGSTTHAFCVVDDLIFDSITPYALRLQKESVNWIFNDVETKIHYALRFNMKRSPPGVQIKEKYTRKVKYNWDHPSHPKKKEWKNG